MNRSLLLALAGVAAVVVLFVIFRPGGDNGASTAPTVTTTSTPTGASTTNTVATKPTPPARTVIPIRIEGARPVGGIVRAKVKQGQTVTLQVTSDTEDEVHLHGYDLHTDVKNGRATLTFKARIAGRFEAELEQHGVQILDLEVTP